MPFVLGYGPSGSVDVYSTLQGDILSKIGPFRPITYMEYDEGLETLSLMDIQFKVQVYNVSLRDLQKTDQEDKKAIFMKPVLVHNLDYTFTANRDEELQVSLNELRELINKCMNSKRREVLLEAATVAETVKKEFNLAESKEMVALLKAFCRLYYESGIKEIKYNFIFEEYSFCEDVEDTFELRVLHFAITHNKMFFAFAPNYGHIIIYSTA